MNVFQVLTFVSFVLTTLPPIGRHRREIDRAKAEGRDADEQEWIRKAENYWGPRMLSHFGITVQRSGEENLPECGVLFVSNHDGYGDIPAFMAAIPEKQAGFIAKEELTKIPIFAKWIKRIRSLMLHRNDPRIAIKVFDEAADLLKRGFSMIIFPEGTRARGLGMKPFAKGSLRIAFKAGAPVVPVAVQGSWDCFEGNGYPCSGLIRFHIFPPIETAGLQKHAETEVSDYIEALIRAKLEEWKNG